MDWDQAWTLNEGNYTVQKGMERAGFHMESTRRKLSTILCTAACYTTAACSASSFAILLWKFFELEDLSPLACELLLYRHYCETLILQLD